MTIAIHIYQYMVQTIESKTVAQKAEKNQFAHLVILLLKSAPRVGRSKNAGRSGLTNVICNVCAPPLLAFVVRGEHNIFIITIQHQTSISKLLFARKAAMGEKFLVFAPPHGNLQFIGCLLVDTHDLVEV